MLIVPIYEAKPGMRLAVSVLSPENPEHELLKRGYELDEAVIQRLKDFGIESLYVDYPGLEDLDRHLTPQLTQGRLKIYNQVKATIAAVEKKAQPTVGFADYYVTMREMVITLLSQGDHPVYLDMIASRLGNEAIHHATAVAHMALALGLHLRTYLMTQRKRLVATHASEVINLGVAGMLHDIGKSRLPEHLRDHCDTSPPAKPDELKQWQTHAQLGYEMLRGGIESSAAAAVLHHHQRFDGSGFPQIKGRNGQPLPQVGEHIHVFARILSAADLFDHLANPPGSSARRSNAVVLQAMQRKFAAVLDPVVLQALQAVAPPYPPGTRVKLSTGQHAVVTGINPDEPWKPSVRQVDAHGKVLPTAAISLAAPDAPRIVPMTEPKAAA